MLHSGLCLSLHGILSVCHAMSSSLCLCVLGGHTFWGEGTFQPHTSDPIPRPLIRINEHELFMPYLLHSEME